MLDTLSLVILSLGTFLSAALILLVLVGNKYDSWIEPLDKKEFVLCELYGVGFVIIDLLKYNFTTKGERKRRQNIALIYGEKHSEYYLRVNAAERFTLSSVILTFGLLLYGLTLEIAIVFVVILFSFVAFYYVGTIPEEKVKKKSESILNEFADVVSKLALLVNAGMILKEAWIKISENGEGELYQEMRRSVEQMNNGVSEIDAYTEFATRCTSPEIKKFTSTIIQGLVKGNRELVEMIKQQSREIWDVKRHHVKQQGEKAASKLLIPICIMFVGVLIMIIVPIFANLVV